MASVSNTNGAFSLKVYRGDAKTLLAFNLSGAEARKNLAGFTIQVKPAGDDSYYLHNNLQFKNPGDHAQDPKEPANSSINAPFHKFRWLHVPGLVHQGLKPLFGQYTYTVTPRYFDDRGSLQPLDSSLSASADILVDNFKTGSRAASSSRRLLSVTLVGTPVSGQKVMNSCSTLRRSPVPMRRAKSSPLSSSTNGSALQRASLSWTSWMR
jgi:hypothetical protein